MGIPVTGQDRMLGGMGLDKTIFLPQARSLTKSVAPEFHNPSFVLVPYGLSCHIKHYKHHPLITALSNEVKSVNGLSRNFFNLDFNRILSCAECPNAAYLSTITLRMKLPDDCSMTTR